MKIQASLLATVAVLAAAPAAAQAERAAGVLDVDGDVLISFDTTAPGEITSAHAIAGLQSGEHIAAIDYRFAPSTLAGTTPAALFGIGVVDAGATDTLRLYVIDQATGAATAVGAPITGVQDGGDYGADFDNASDRLRVVHDGDENLRINPNNGARADTPQNDTNLNPASQNVEALAYDRADQDPNTNTTAYVLANSDNTLRTLGGIDRSPSPNLGQLFNVGSLGVTPQLISPRELDISPSGTAFATFSPGAGGPGLYTVNVSTGAATLAASMPYALRGLAVLPSQLAQLSAAEYSVAEGQIATVTVTRIGASSGSAIVDYAVRAGSASGTDFSTATGTLTMAPGETERSFTVNTSNDVADEPDETLGITLSNPRAPLLLGAPAVGTITILDDDDPAPVATPTVTPDTTAPKVTITVPKSITLARLKRGLKVTLTPSEPAAFDIAMQVTPRSARISAYELTLARRTLPLAGGARSVTLKSSRKLLGNPRRSFKLRLSVVATDHPRNPETASKIVTVKVPRRR